LGFQRDLLEGFDEILNIWNHRVREIVKASHKKYGAENCACEHWKHWKFGGYNMNFFFLAPL